MFRRHGSKTVKRRRDRSRSRSLSDDDELDEDESGCCDLTPTVDAFGELAGNSLFTANSVSLTLSIRSLSLFN